jgi:hypothetical protein
VAQLRSGANSKEVASLVQGCDSSASNPQLNAGGGILLSADRFSSRVRISLDDEKSDPGFLGLVRDRVKLHVSSFPGDGVSGAVAAFVVEDVDALHAEFLGKGVTISLEPTDQFSLLVLAGLPIAERHVGLSQSRAGSAGVTRDFRRVGSTDDHVTGLPMFSLLVRTGQHFPRAAAVVSFPLFCHLPSKRPRAGFLTARLENANSL